MDCSQLFLSGLGSFGVHGTQKQVGSAERHEGKARRASSWLAGAGWHEEVDENEARREKPHTKERGRIGRYGKLLSGG